MTKDFRIKNMSCNGKPIPDKYIICFNGYIEDVVNKAFAGEQQLAIEELEKFKNYIFTRIYLTANGDKEKINTYVDLKIKSLKGE